MKDAELYKMEIFSRKEGGARKKTEDYSGQDTLFCGKGYYRIFIVLIRKLQTIKRSRFWERMKLWLSLGLQSNGANDSIWD